MKNAGIITLLLFLIFMVSCNNNETKNHNHETDLEETIHSHEGEDLAAHNHEADAGEAHNHEADAGEAHNHEADAGAAHNHEADAAHTHEADAAHTHEADATHTHEADAAHTHEADAGAAHNHEADAAHTHETDATHTHEADAADTHEADAGAAHNHEADATAATGNAISFPYKSIKLSLQSFHLIKKTSGELSMDKKGEVSIIANSSGIVHFNDSFLYPGIKLDKGELIFKVEGGGLTEDNTALNFARVEADYKKAKTDLERASGLIEEKLITQAHYLEIKNEFEKSDAEYKVYLSSVGGDFSSVKTHQSGYLNQIFVNEGDKVEAGDKLASIQTKNHMVLRADISPTDFDIIDRISAAKFAFGYSMKVYNTEEMGGELISRGRSSDINSFYIPVFFKIDYDENLIPGTFADVWLIGDEIKDVIVIPNNSILEEFGKYYVYIDHGDHFDKRYIIPGRSDGEKTHVLTGLIENESIVTDGVYQVKMSMMTSIPNTHDHSH